MRKQRLLLRDDGMTLIELSIGALIAATAAVVFFGVLTTVQSTLARQTERSANNDQVRLAVQQLDREVRSGNLLYNPSAESPANFTVRVYSQSNAVGRCIQWVVSGERLLRRQWTPTFDAYPPSDISVWRTVATGVVNRTVSPAVPAFSVSETSAAVGRTLDIMMLVNGNVATRPTQTARVQLSVTGRNTTRGTAQSACDPVPPIGVS